MSDHSGDTGKPKSHAILKNLAKKEGEAKDDVKDVMILNPMNPVNDSTNDHEKHGAEETKTSKSGDWKVVANITKLVTSRSSSTSNKMGRSGSRKASTDLMQDMCSNGGTKFEKYKSLRMTFKGEDSYHNMIPVAYLLRLLYKMEEWKRFIALIFYSLYFIIFAVTFLNLADVSTVYDINSYINGNFVEQQFSYMTDNYTETYLTNFNDICNKDMVIEWIADPLYNNLWLGDMLGNGTALGIGITEDFVLLDTVQLRQVKVLSVCSPIITGITLGQRFTSNSSNLCFPEFSFDLRDHGNKTTFNSPSVSESYQTGLSDISGYRGFHIDYGTEGWVIELSRDSNVAIKQINSIRDSGWINRATRAVTVSWNMYDSSSGKLVVVRVLFQFSSGGFVKRSYYARTFQDSVYNLNKKNNVIYYICITIMFVAQISRELGLYFPLFWDYSSKLLKQRKFCIEVTVRKRSFISRVRTLWRLNFMTRLINFLHICIMAITGGLFIQFAAFNSYKNSLNDETRQGYIDLFPMSEMWVRLNAFGALCFMIMFVQLFRRFSVSKKLLIIIDTIKEAAFDLAAFLTFVAVYTVTFAFSTYLLFGDKSINYHNFNSALYTLLYACVGHYDYQELSFIRPDFAPFISICYAIPMLFVVLNVFISILSKYFDRVHDNANEQEGKIQKELITPIGLLNYFHILYRTIFPKKEGKFKDDTQYEISIEVTIKEILSQVQNRFMRLGDIELLQFIETIYFSGQRRLTMITMEELCYLFRSYIPEGGDKLCHHAGETCEAKLLCDAYHKQGTQEVGRNKFEKFQRKGNLEILKSQTFDLIHRLEEFESLFLINKFHEDGSEIACRIFIDFFGETKTKIMNKRYLRLYSLHMNELEKYALTDLIQIEISKEKINSYADDVGFPTSKNLILVFRTGVLRIYFPHPNYNCDPDVDPNSDQADKDKPNKILENFIRILKAAMNSDNHDFLNTEFSKKFTVKNVDFDERISAVMSKGGSSHSIKGKK